MNVISPFEFYRRFSSARSLAVVGNAPTVLQYDNGERIDGHDLVVRFNRATTDGHEDKMGRRTDILVVNASNSNKLGKPPAETVRPKCLVTFVSPAGIPNIDYDAFVEWVGDIPIMLVFGPDLIGIRSDLRSRPLTSGTYFLFMATRLMALEKLFVTGFTMFGAVPGGSGKFYQDARPGIGTFHDLDSEEPIFAQLLSSFSGSLEMTAEVNEIVQRNGRGKSPANGAAIPQQPKSRVNWRERIAGAVSWRLMGLAMRLRRISEVHK